MVMFDAVEEIDVVLAAGAGARTAERSCEYIDARDELLQVAVILLTGRRWILVCDSRSVSVDCLSTRVLAAVTVIDSRRRSRQLDVRALS